MFVIMHKYYSWSLPPSLSPSPLIRRKSLPENQPTLAPQVTARLGISLPTEARQDSPVRGAESAGRQQYQEKPTLQLFGGPT